MTGLRKQLAEILLKGFQPDKDGNGSFCNGQTDGPDKKFVCGHIGTDEALQVLMEPAAACSCWAACSRPKNTAGLC